MSARLKRLVSDQALDPMLEGYDFKEFKAVAYDEAVHHILTSMVFQHDGPA